MIGKLKHRRPGVIVSVFAGLATIFGLVLLVRSGTAEEPIKQLAGSITSDEAIARLLQGNRRCVEGESAHGHDLAKWRERFLVKQKPFATVLGCSDSRVAPELLFDQGFGELFVIRVAGNIVDSDVVGSIQYAVEHLDNKLIVVLGHQNCGAVTAALTPPDQTKNEPPELRKLLDRIRPALESVDRQQEREQRVATAVEANARASVKQLRQVPSIAAAIKIKNVKVVGAVYQVDSGRITFLDERHP
jgi:carbonic anhydrase